MTKLTYENQGYLDRIQRAESWIEKAKAIGEWEDHHGQFIFYWIALNALYGRNRDSRRFEQDDQTWFLNRISSLDNRGDRDIWKALDRLKSKADRLLKDQFLVSQYWDEGATLRVKQIIDNDFAAAQRAWDRGDVERYLNTLLKRISMLRNQIFHSCSTDRRSLNKNSLIPALHILESIDHTLLEVMRNHGGKGDWPMIPYPRKDSPQHLK